MEKTKIFKTFFVVGMLLLLSMTSVMAVPIVSLDLPTSVAIGETFTVDVIVDGVTDDDPVFGPDFVLAFGFDVVKPASFTYNGASVWPGLLDDITYYDDSSLFPDVDVAGSTFPDPFVFGDDELFGDNILLATISFTASEAGNFSLGISSDIIDPIAGEGLYTFLNTALDMTTSADITEEPTVTAATVPFWSTPTLLFSALHTMSEVISIGFPNRSVPEADSSVVS